MLFVLVAGSSSGGHDLDYHLAVLNHVDGVTGANHFAAHDFAENASIINRHQMVMQSDYWAPVVLCRQMSSNSATAHVFSECSGENGVEEAQ